MKYFNKIRRCFYSLIALCLVFSMFSFNVFAVEFTGSKGFTGALSHDDFLAQRIVPQQEVLTAAQLAKRAEKMAYSASLQSSSPDGTSKAVVTWDYLNNYFAVYGQIYSNYCGPASVKSSLMYLNGSSPTQDQIASGCGTTSNGTYLANMVTYMNNRLTTTYYTPQYRATKSAMQNYLWSGIQYDDPPIIGFACSTSQGWRYNSGGHFVLVNGARTDREEFNLADPGILYLGLTGSFYDKSASDLYTAYNSVNIGLCW